MLKKMKIFVLEGKEKISEINRWIYDLFSLERKYRKQIDAIIQRGQYQRIRYMIEMIYIQDDNNIKISCDIDYLHDTDGFFYIDKRHINTIDMCLSVNNFLGKFIEGKIEKDRIRKEIEKSLFMIIEYEINDETTKLYI
jgi:hypothetical protein